MNKIRKGGNAEMTKVKQDEQVQCRGQIEQVQRRHEPVTNLFNADMNLLLTCSTQT